MIDKSAIEKDKFVRKVITFGVFDYFHLGHLRLFKRAKKLGDYLIVAVQDGNYILKTKPNATIMYSTMERKELVSALRVVDEVVTYTDVDVSIKEFDFDVFVVGEDQNHDGFQRAIQWCNDNEKKVVRLERTRGICSSDIKSNLK